MNKEQMIKDARTIEAMKKGYMGLEGKFANVVKRLGEPIFHQGSRVFEQTFLDDPYDLSSESEEIPMMDGEENSYEVGWQFDGLSSGINMTISVHYHLREITCRFMGQIVYQETSGELEGYAPDPMWEEKLESLVLLAKKTEKKQRPIEKKVQIAENTKKKMEFLEYLRKKWAL